MTNPPSTEERVWAVLAHLSAMAFGMGLLLPVIGWSEQRRKSKYASFHCLQALGYQSLGFTVWLLSYLVLLIVFIVVMAFGMALMEDNSAQSTSLLFAGFNIVLFIVVIGGFGLYFIFPLIAAASCALGKDFRYPIMGDRLARYLGYDPSAASGELTWLIEEHEDRWVAAMGHVGVIMFLWGMLAPLTAWILQGRRSLFVKFQSVQTVVYQAFTNLLYMGSGMVYTFGVVVLLVLTGFEAVLDRDSSVAMIGIVILIVSMLIATLIVLLVPLLHILGQWAGYRVLKGDEYRYPLIGNWVVRWMGNRESG